MSTVVVQVGNTDNKLTQQRWFSFTHEVANIMSMFGQQHFSGGPATNAPFQNWCWVVARMNVSTEERDRLHDELRKVREKYEQDSVAVMWGDTSFI